MAAQEIHDSHKMQKGTFLIRIIEFNMFIFRQSIEAETDKCGLI